MAHPIAQSTWSAAYAAFRAEHPETIPALGHVSDLAERAFLGAVEGKEEDPRFAAEAPRVARFYLLDFVIRWEKSSKRRRR